MAKNSLCRDKRGLFVRNLGWKLTASGEYSQEKFYIGRDEAKAKIASLKLEQLWKAACARWEASNPPKPRRKPDPSSQSLVNGLVPASIDDDSQRVGFTNVVTIGVGEIEYVREGKPVWDDVTLAIADAIRSCEPIARVPVLKGGVAAR